MKRQGALGAASLAIVLLAACGGEERDAGGKRKVAVSIFPLYDVARRVAGDALDVILVLPPGRSEHGFDPTPREMAQVAGADLGVVVGLEMDPWASRIIRGAAGDDTEILELGPAVEPRRLSAPEVGVDLLEHAREHGHDHDDHHDDDHHDDHDHDEEGEGEAHGHHEEAHEGHHHHGAFDPHFWLDPLRMVTAVDRLVDAFARLDPAHADGFRERGEAVKRELRALHDQLEERAEGWDGQTIVTFHGSFGYFAERYGLTIAAVIEPFPGREPTPRYMQEVLEAIRASGTRALFSEPQLDPRPGRVIAQQSGVTLHQLDPVGGTSGVDTYERLLLHDADVIDRALGD